MSHAADRHLKPLNILLVEDDDGDAKSVVRAFRNARIANPIVRALDGIEALQIIRRKHEQTIDSPFVVLIDVRMPRMSGHEFLDELRKDPALKRTVVYMLTTSSDQRDIDRAHDQLVAGYILKDKAGEDFVHLVSALKSFWRIAELPWIEANTT